MSAASTTKGNKMADGEVRGSAFMDAARRFVESEDSIVDASRALKAFLRSQIPLVRKVSPEIADLAESVMEAAAFAAVTKVQRGNRKIIWSSKQPDVTAGQRIRSSGYTRSLMDFPLRSGKRLGDAVRDEVQADAENYEKVSADAQNKAQWLSAIAEHTKVGKTVSQCLTEEDLRKFRGD